MAGVESFVPVGSALTRISFEIEGKTLGEAVAGYGPAAKEGVERTMRELQELRRQQAVRDLVQAVLGQVRRVQRRVEP